MNPASIRRWISISQLLLIAASLVAFAEIADAALDPQDLPEHDLPVASWFTDRRTGGVTTAMLVLTWLGSGLVTTPIVLVAALAIPTRVDRARHLAVVVAVTAGTAFMVQNIKFLTARPRPDALEAAVTSNGFAFPSGHTAQAAAAYGILAWLIAVRFQRLRVTAWILAGLITGTVGLSRLYLGVHWLTDVLGGLTLATAWLAIVLVGAKVVGTPKVQHPPANPNAG